METALVSSDLWGKNYSIDGAAFTCLIESFVLGLSNISGGPCTSV